MVFTQIEHLQTLHEAREDDLRKVGLKMGDIIKIRRVLACQQIDSLDSSLSSMSETEPEERNPASSPVVSGQVRNLACSFFFASDIVLGNKVMW